jgi:hypothetical protein
VGGGSPPPAPAPAPAEPQARASIGAAGGEVAFADKRFKLTIPAGALGNETEIVITELSPANVPASLQPLNAEKVYRLEPHGLQFAQPVTAIAQLPSSDVVPQLVHESNGNFEDPDSHQIVLTKNGHTVSGRISHFSNLAVSMDLPVLAQVDVTPKQLLVGEPVKATAVLQNKDTFFIMTVLRTVFEATNVEVDDIESITYPRNLLGGARIAGSLKGRCKAKGQGSVSHSATFAPHPLPQPGPGRDPNQARKPVTVTVVDSFECVESLADAVIPTGVFSANVTNPDDVRALRGPFANLTTPGPFATVGGSNGMVVIDLVNRTKVLDFTTIGPERDALGSPLIGALPVSQAGAHAPAALFGFGTTGLSTVRTALRNYDPASGSFGFTSLGFTPTFDATTVGGDTIADSFLSTAPGGIQLYGFDATNGYQVVPNGAISATRFGGGQLVSAFRGASGSAILALTRGHDANTTSRLWSHSGTGTEPATPIATLPGDARRIRCTNVRANASFCGVTLASGSTALLMFDSTNPTAAVAPLTVPTGLGSLGIAVGVRENGNPYAVVANLNANSLNVIEVTPDMTLVGNTSIATPAGVAQPAHVALVKDSEGDKVVVTGNGSGNLWVERVFQ